MKKAIITSCLAFVVSAAIAQPEDDLLKELEKENPVKAEPVSATFKGTRLVNLPTVEVSGKGILEFRIAHRFGDIAGTSGGASTLFGLDGPVALHLAFDYSLSNNLSVGIGRTNIDKLIDGNIKYRILRQSTDGKMPVSVTYQGRISATHRDEVFPGELAAFAHRISYANHLMVARKFNSAFSLQMSLIHIHRNLVEWNADKNSMLAASLSGRAKITRRIALTGEYAVRMGQYISNQNRFYNPLAFGVDLETGGHVFQMFFANSFTINETQMIPRTDRTWTKGQFRWGFNVSRVF